MCGWRYQERPHTRVSFAHALSLPAQQRCDRCWPPARSASSAQEGFVSSDTGIQPSHHYEDSGLPQNSSFLLSLWVSSRGIVVAVRGHTKAAGVSRPGSPNAQNKKSMVPTCRHDLTKKWEQEREKQRAKFWGGGSRGRGRFKKEKKTTQGRKHGAQNKKTLKNHKKTEKKKHGAKGRLVHSRRSRNNLEKVNGPESVGRDSAMTVRRREVQGREVQGRLGEGTGTKRPGCEKVGPSGHQPKKTAQRTSWPGT